jgi:hypothetical protein
VKVKDLTDLDWDRVCAVHTAYASADDIVRVIGFKPRAFSGAPWYGGGPYWELFFVKGERDVIHVRVYKRIVNLGGESACAKRDTARLAIRWIFPVSCVVYLISD